MPDPAITPLLVPMTGLVGASAFFSAAETAIFYLGPRDMEVLGGGKTHVGRRIQGLLRDRKELLVTVLLANLVINILYFNIGVLLSVRLADAGFTAWAVALPLLVLAVLVVFGEVVPKTVAVTWPVLVSRVAAEPLYWLKRGLWLPGVVLASVADAIGRLLVGTQPEEGDLTPGELGDLLQLAATEGHLHEDEHQVLQAVLMLADMEIREVMIPRVEIVSVELRAEEDPAAFRARLLEVVPRHRLNKLPIFRNSLDEVVGFVDVKEVLSGRAQAVEEWIHPVVFVPEATPVTAALQRFRSERVRMMIVVDEYGGTEGLITHEDLVEAVVGDLVDEQDPRTTLAPVGPEEWLVDADLGIRSFAQVLGIPPTFREVMTLGGLVTMRLGRIPRVGDRVSAGQVDLEVVSVRKRRADRVRVRLARRTAHRETPL